MTERINYTLEAVKYLYGNNATMGEHPFRKPIEVKSDGSHIEKVSKAGKLSAILDDIASSMKSKDEKNLQKLCNEFKDALKPQDALKQADVSTQEVPSARAGSD